MALDMLDTVIGMIFIYLLLSLICTAVNEFVEGFIKLRAVDLEQGLRELLNDPDGSGLVAQVYNHQLIYSLFRGEYKATDIRNQNDKLITAKKKRYSRGSDLPSYIPSRNFALALMDVLLPPGQPAPAAPAVAPNTGGSAAALAPYNVNLPTLAAPPVKPNQLAALRNAVMLQSNTKVKNALLTIIDAAGDDAIKAREGIEDWFNSAMDRVSGWYKRRVQQIVFIMGFAIALALNADSIALFRNLANERPLRNAIVTQAQTMKEGDSALPSTEKIKKNVNSLLSMGLPLGWGWKHRFNNGADAIRNPAAVPESPFNWVVKVLGWLITGLAVSLGAPFWFDLLNKIMIIRSTVKPAEKSTADAGGKKT